MVITAGIAWGFSGVSGQYLMAHGVNVNLLTSLRLLLSGILLTASVFLGSETNWFKLLKIEKP
ncbi:Drug/metabolite transporter (DMT) superfamily protein [Streptococcus sp. HSISS2]|nr:Drug/metabolite transporter (DMT) superfamily protein [Streptococcus sp. HSISS2]